jgi:hypothetical protein
MKRNSNIICWAAAGFFMAACLMRPADCFAGMAVSPMQQQVTVNPGQNASFSVTVTNVNRGFDALPCKVNVSVLDFTVSPQGAILFDKDAGHSRSAVDWISLDANELVLEPGEFKEIKGKVSAPFNADGDYWAAIMVSLENPKKQEKGVNINLRTASGIFVRVERRKNAERASIIDANVILPRFVPNENPAVDSNESRASQYEQSLEINTELKNDGMVSFLAKGKAFLYDENWHRVASIPLYSKRRQILPGHTRYFTGVMAQPLPAGKYKLRVIFEMDSNFGRKTTKDMEFSVSQKLADQWAGNFTFKDIQTLKIEPQELKLTLTGGRFTTTKALVINQCLSTVSVSCRLETDNLPEDWLEISPAEFTLNPNTRRNVICSVRIPKDAEQGEYNGIIYIKVERSGLTVKNQNNVELHKIPIFIVIDK